MRITSPSTRSLAAAAVASLAAFPLIIIGLGLAQAAQGYDVRRQAMSELALGRFGWLMALAFCAGGIGTFLVAVLLRRTTDGAVVRPTLLVLAAVCTVASAVFRTDATGATTTVHGQIHVAIGIASFLTQLVSLAACSVRFRREPAWQRLTNVTRVFLVLGIAGFLCVPALGQADFGLSQRLLVGALVGWMLLAAAWVGRSSTSSHPLPQRVGSAAADLQKPVGSRGV